MNKILSFPRVDLSFRPKLLKKGRGLHPLVSNHCRNLQCRVDWRTKSQRDSLSLDFEALKANKCFPVEPSQCVYTIHRRGRMLEGRWSSMQSPCSWRETTSFHTGPKAQNNMPNIIRRTGILLISHIFPHPFGAQKMLSNLQNICAYHMLNHRKDAFTVRVKTRLMAWFLFFVVTIWSR